jgi:enoyl-CoA hydratase/carnithine racemase
LDPGTTTATSGDRIFGLVANILSLRPSDLVELPPPWEPRVHPGEVAIAVIDGTDQHWDELTRSSRAALAELEAAPLITLGVVRGGAAPAAAGGCDLLVTGEDDAAIDARVATLLGAVERSGAPALVASHVLRGAGAQLASEACAYSMLMSGEPFGDWLAAHDRHATSDAASPRVSVTWADAVWIVRLTRPHRHNAFDARMREELCDALDAIASRPPAPVVLLGEGPSFCTGGDLGEFGTASSPLAAYLVRTSRSVARRLARLGDRLVAGVHGYCIGAGIELAAFAQTVIAAESATFSLPELGLGLGLGAGGTVSIPARIGRQRTLELLLAGEPIGAEQALAWGLVDHVVTDEDLELRAMAAAEALA